MRNDAEGALKQPLDHVIDEMLDAGFPLATAQQLFLDAYVSAALRRNHDNVTATAQALSTHRNTIHTIIRTRANVKESMKRKRKHSPARTQAQLRTAFLVEQSKRERRG